MTKISSSDGALTRTCVEHASFLYSYGSPSRVLVVGQVRAQPITVLPVESYDRESNAQMSPSGMSGKLRFRIEAKADKYFYAKCVSDVTLGVFSSNPRLNFWDVWPVLWMCDFWHMACAGSMEACNVPSVAWHMTTYDIQFGDLEYLVRVASRMYRLRRRSHFEFWTVWQPYYSGMSLLVSSLVSLVSSLLS